MSAGEREQDSRERPLTAGRGNPQGVPGADKSLYSLAVPSDGFFPFAANAVQRGDLVFSISLPSSPFSKVELLKLSETVLARLSADSAH